MRCKMYDVDIKCWFVDSFDWFYDYYFIIIVEHQFEYRYGLQFVDCANIHTLNTNRTVTWLIICVPSISSCVYACWSLIGLKIFNMVIVNNVPSHRITVSSHWYTMLVNLPSVGIWFGVVASVGPIIQLPMCPMSNTQCMFNIHWYPYSWNSKLNVKRVWF